MAYETGSATSCANVLQSLANFCTSYGWTVDNNAAYSGGWWLAVHKGSGYLNFVVPSGDGEIQCYGATGFSSSAAPTAQAGVSQKLQVMPGNTSTGVDAGPYVAYHFFSSSSGTYLHCLIEVTAGVFAHFHAGELNAMGGATPAIYLTVSDWYRYIPANSGDPYPSNPDDGLNAKPFTNDYSYNSGGGCTTLGCTVDSTFRWFMVYGGSTGQRLNAMGNSIAGANGWTATANARSPNTFNGLSVLTPIPFFAERAVGNIYSLVGEAPDIRFVNMKNNNAKDEVTLGSDTWKLFPIIANSPVVNIAGGAASSWPYGLAFKKSA